MKRFFLAWAAILFSYGVFATGAVNHIDEMSDDDIITFADPLVKSICVTNWDTNKDGELSKVEAAAVKNVGYLAFRNTNITTFDEFQYFTGLTSLASCFEGCTNLKSIILPEQLTIISQGAFARCSSLASIVIPDNVEVIGANAFARCSILSTVRWSNSLKSIELNAFNGCSGIVTISLPESITTIGACAFQYCRGLTSVIIPKGLESIGNNAFDGCSALTDITLPEKMTSIGWCAFQDCSNLKGIVIPNGVKTIDRNMFFGCKNLATVTIPTSVDSISDNAFYECDGLKEVHISDLKAWCSIALAWESSSPLHYAHHLFLNSEEVKNLVIPDEVEEIRDYVFYGCSGLSSVSFPSSLKNIGTDAFRDCTGLEAVHISDVAAWCGFSFCNYQNPLYYAHHLFLNGEEVKNLVIPGSVTEIKGNAFCGCTSLASVTIPPSLTKIASGAFSGCSNLESVYITDMATWCGMELSSNPFDLAHHLFLKGDEVTNLTIPSNVTTVRPYVFSGCAYVTQASIPTNVKSIGDYAFSSCGIHDIELPSTVTQLGEGVFTACKSLQSVKLPETMTRLPANTFYECSKLANIVFPNHLLGIGNSAFFGTGFKTISLPETVVNIEANAFQNSSLESIDMTCPIDRIPEGLFCGCKHLTHVTLPASCTAIGSNAFYECILLDSIDIPEGVTSIGDRAFSYCERLVSVTLPSSLTYLNHYDIFSYCKSLATMTLPANLQPLTVYSGGGLLTGSSNFNVLATLSPIPMTLNGNPFGRALSNVTLYVPQGAKEVYQNSEVWKDFKDIRELSANDNYTFTIQVSGEGKVFFGDMTISNATKQLSLPERSVVFFDIVPNTGFMINQLTVNGVAKDRNKRWSTALTEDVTVLVDFKKTSTHHVEIQVFGPGKTTWNLSDLPSFDYVLENETKTFEVSDGSSITFTTNFSSQQRMMVEGFGVFSVTPGNAGRSFLGNIAGHYVNSMDNIQRDTYISLRIYPYYDSGTLFTIDGLQYHVLPSSGAFRQVEVTWFASNSYEIEIPEQVENNGVTYRVTSIAPYAFCKNRALTYAKGNYVYNHEGRENLMTLTIPKTVTSIGENLFMGRDHLSSIIYHSPTPLTDTMVNGLTNPNLLLYVDDASQNQTSIRNVVVNGHAEEIVLTDQEKWNDFHCPLTFTASKVSYTHRYAMQSGMGASQGWETLVLPFDVKTITHATKGELTPFSKWDASSKLKPFWLYNYSSVSGWASGGDIFANTPYIICMPNNPAYRDEYNVAGEVTFSATNSKVHSSENMLISTYNNRTLTPNYKDEWTPLEGLEDSYRKNVLNVNNIFATNTSDYLEGSTFIKNLREVHPFEAYMVDESGSAAAIAIFDDLPTDIPDLLFMAPGEVSGIGGNMPLRVMTLSGQVVREVAPGGSLDNATRGLPAGLYIVGNRKVVVK